MVLFVIHVWVGIMRFGRFVSIVVRFLFRPVAYTVCTYCYHGFSAVHLVKSYTHAAIGHDDLSVYGGGVVAEQKKDHIYLLINSSNRYSAVHMTICGS